MSPHIKYNEVEEEELQNLNSHDHLDYTLAKKFSMLFVDVVQ